MIDLPGYSYIGDKIKNPFNVPVNVGKYTSIAEGLVIFASDHPMDAVSTYPFREKLGCDYPPCMGLMPVNIGNDVWIGMNATIKQGITIGDGAVIGAGSVVVKDVDSYSIVCGNPAQRAGWRFSGEVIMGLLSIAWWNWPHDKVLRALPDMEYPEIFISKYLSGGSHEAN